MLAKVKLDKKYKLWNKKWGAPFSGIFSYQRNNFTRYFEYPWAFYAVKFKKGMKVIDFGGGLSGFQFVLNKRGLDVINIDPGVASKGRGWPVNKNSLGRLNKKFSTGVKLYNSSIKEANLPSESYDIIYSISVLEHLTKEELKEAMSEFFRVLKKGGYLVLTIDLFVSLYPFTSRKRNKWGTNISIKKLINSHGFKMVYGKKSELHGFKDFDKRKILGNLDKYFIGLPAVLTQLVILKK